MSEEPVRYEGEDEREARQKIQQKRLLEDLEDLRVILNDERGARVIYRILGRLGMFRRVFRSNSKVYEAAARHDAALEIFQDMVMADPARAHSLLTEGHNRQAKEEANG